MKIRNRVMAGVISLALVTVPVHGATINTGGHTVSGNGNHVYTGGWISHGEDIDYGNITINGDNQASGVGRIIGSDNYVYTQGNHVSGENSNVYTEGNEVSGNGNYVHTGGNNISGDNSHISTGGNHVSGDNNHVFTGGWTSHGEDINTGGIFINGDNETVDQGGSMYDWSYWTSSWNRAKRDYNGYRGYSLY